jgi:hypothetical protein
MLTLAGLLLLVVAPACDWGGGSGDDQLTGKQGLYRCQTCEEVLDWLQQMAILQMERTLDSYYDGGYYDDDDTGWDDDSWFDDDTAAADDDDDAADDDQAGDDEGGDDTAPPDDNAGGDDDHSDTNVQEEGVDEADLVKTDGEYLYLVTGGYFLVFDSDPESETHESSRVDIEGTVLDMFLYHDLAVVFSHLYVEQLSDDIWPEVPNSDLYYDVLKITIIDHSNKFVPLVLRELYVEGWVVSSRLVNDSVRIVVNTAKYGPDLDYELDWSNIHTPEDLAAAIAALKAENREIIENAGLEEWIPRYYAIDHRPSGLETSSGFLVDCQNHYRPEDPMGTSILSVITLLLTEPLERQVDISVIADGYVVYASSLNLYVSGSVDAAWTWAEDQTDFEDQSPIHRFDIETDPAEAIYKGSASVNGWLLNQFNMSEYQGYLRVAVTYGGWRDGTPERNGIYVFHLTGDGLALAGALEDIALNETIYAARMMGPRGYLVTYEQTDPLFTVDLSDPEHPTMVGELQMPGFSTYLHPMDDNHLLAIGQGGTDWGADGTMVVSMFDVSDFAEPDLLWQYDFGYSYSEAQYNHHAFFFDAERHLLAVPVVTTYWGDDDTWGDDDDTWGGDDDQTEPAGDDGYFSGVVVLRATAASGFAELAAIDHSQMQPEDGGGYYYGVSQPRRTVRIGEYLFTISDVGLIVTAIGTWQNAQEISLPWEEPYYGGDDDWDGGGGEVPPGEGLD